MARTAELLIRVKSTSDGSGVDKASTKMDRFKGSLAKAAIPAALVSAAVIKLGKDAVDSASHLQQAMGGVDAVFGKNAATINKWGAAAADSIGLAKSDYADLATLIGSQMKNAGLPMDQVTKKTGSLIQKGADLAAMYGGTTKEAVEALSSAFKGEFDPLEKYGTSLNQTKVNAELAASGADKLTGKAASQAKALATLKLITEQTKDATGAAAREQDTAAARAQQLSANIENLKADLGTALLPVVSAITGKLATLAQWMAKNKTTTQILIGVIGGLAAAVLVINAAVAAWTATQAAFNVVMAANPIGLIIVAIIALGVALVVAYKKSETFRNVVNGAFAAVKVAAAGVVKAFRAIGGAAQAVFSWIRSHWRLLAAILFGPVGIAVGVITKYWSQIRSTATKLLSWIRTAFRTAFSAISTVVGTYVTTIKTVIRGIRDAVGAVVTKFGDLIRKIKDVSIPGTIKTAVDKIATAVGKVVSAVQSLIDKIGNIPTPHIDWPTPPKWFSKINPFSAMAPIPAGPTVAPSVATARPAGRLGAASSAAGGGLTINVTGALDPEAVARQIGRIVNGHERRVGLRTA